MHGFKIMLKSYIYQGMVHMPVNLALGRQKDQKCRAKLNSTAISEASLRYKRPYLQKPINYIY